MPEFFAQPRLDVLPREIATRLLTGGQCPPVMVTANAFVEKHWADKIDRNAIADLQCRTRRLSRGMCCLDSSRRVDNEG